MKHKNLRIIGTSHIAKQSVNEVNRAVELEKPDIVALELDPRRAEALMSRQKRQFSLRLIRIIGLKGFIFSLIGAWAEKKLGDYVGMVPGAEMKQAIRLARKEKIRLAYIDQDIEITLRRFSDKLSWRERWNFIVDIFNAVVLRKKEIGFDLNTVPDKELIQTLLKKVKARYPNIYQVLIEERNAVMAKKLHRLMEQNPNSSILALVGAGHEEGIMEMIKGFEPSINYSFSIG